MSQNQNLCHSVTKNMHDKIRLLVAGAVIFLDFYSRWHIYVKLDFYSYVQGGRGVKVDGPDDDQC